MVNEAHTDHGTVLRPDQAAFVVNADGSYSLQSRSRKSAQDDKWSFCLTAGTLCPSYQERP